MANFTMTLPRPSNLEGTIANVKVELQEKGGSFIGDATGGTIKLAGVEGTYEPTASNILIHVTKTPAIPFIEMFIKKEITAAFEKCSV